ncbi:YciI family protein [Massilia horti]|uniref:YCII-related domain-containing protein n=1 Tax=Massilia horti TaxID=2562153 RepID=A0A4Y9SYK4_9BURK|nr:YciI family protein [Massilia horti]TFW31525.1 hypothetical protein E4O92_13470 [Massilia horti]
MRFMLIEKNGNRAGACEAGAPERARYEQALVRAGVLLASERLRPGAGDAAEVAGFWLIEVKSKEEAAEWVRRSGMNARIELREVLMPDEFAARGGVGCGS